VEEAEEQAGIERSEPERSGDSPAVAGQIAPALAGPEGQRRKALLFAFFLAGLVSSIVALVNRDSPVGGNGDPGRGELVGLEKCRRHRDTARQRKSGFSNRRLHSSAFTGSGSVALNLV
jgi:hypothetical protein